MVWRSISTAVASTRSVHARPAAACIALMGTEITRRSAANPPGGLGAGGQTASEGAGPQRVHRSDRFRLAGVIAAPALFLSVMIVAAERGEAHRPMPSAYTYNEDVFPILRDRCGSCHVAGGVAPMSLMTFRDALLWGESIRTELVAGHMPPWTVDDATGRFRNAQALSGRELNVLLTWASGGYPMGDAERMPPPVALQQG